MWIVMLISRKYNNRNKVINNNKKCNYKTSNIPISNLTEMIKPRQIHKVIFKIIKKIFYKIVKS